MKHFLEPATLFLNPSKSAVDYAYTVCFVILDLKGDILCCFSFSLVSSVLCRLFVYVKVQQSSKRGKFAVNGAPLPESKQ